MHQVQDVHFVDLAVDDEGLAYILFQADRRQEVVDDLGVLLSGERLRHGRFSWLKNLTTLNLAGISHSKVGWLYGCLLLQIMSRKGKSPLE